MELQSDGVSRQRSRPSIEQDLEVEEEAPMAATPDGPWARFVLNSHLHGTWILFTAVPICAVISGVNGHAGKFADADAAPVCRRDLAWEICCSGYRMPEVLIFLPACTLAFCFYALGIWQAAMFLAEDAHQPAVVVKGELYRFSRSTALDYDDCCADRKLVEITDTLGQQQVLMGRWPNGFQHAVRVEDLRTVPVGKLPARLFLVAGLVGCFLATAALWVFPFEVAGQWTNNIHLELAQYAMISFLMSMALRSAVGCAGPCALLARLTTVVTAIAGLTWSLGILYEVPFESAEWVAVFSLALHTISWPVRAARRDAPLLGARPEALLPEAGGGAP